MNSKIRAAREDEMNQFRAVIAYAFGDNETDPESSENALVAAEWTTCAFVDGQLASTLASYPFRMRWNGATADVAGLTAVGTMPEFRRRGLLRATITQSFREQRERGQSMAILWASYGGIYQRFGYGPATNRVGYRFDPRWASLHEGLEASGSVRTTSDRAGALPLLKQIYRKYCGPRHLLLHRADAIWQMGVYRVLDKKHKARIATYHDASGEATGYLVYQLEVEGDTLPNQRLEVCDFVATDVESHIGLWQFILAHDLVAEVRMEAVAEDDPSPLLVANPSKLGRTVHEGLFLRIVDAERAIALRPYGESGRITLGIPRDAECAWNEGTFLLEADEGGQRVKRTSGAPDLALPPRSLATLLAGYASATQLARAGQLDARDPEVLRRADRMFRTDYRPFCPNGF